MASPYQENYKNVIFLLRLPKIGCASKRLGCGCQYVPNHVYISDDRYYEFQRAEATQVILPTSIL